MLSGNRGFAPPRESVSSVRSRAIRRGTRVALSSRRFRLEVPLSPPSRDPFSSSATPAGAAARVPSGWADRLRRLALDVRLVANDHIELAVLEAQRAGQVLVRSIAAAVVISVLVATAWLGIVVAIVVWLAEHVPLPAALLIGAAACLALAGGIGWWVVKHAPEMMFEATLRQLKATATAEDEAERDEDDDDQAGNKTDNTRSATP